LKGYSIAGSLLDDVYHVIPRRYRHIKPLACASAAEDAFTAVIIIRTEIRDFIWRTELPQVEDLLLCHRPPASQVLDLKVTNLPNCTDFSGETAILLMVSIGGPR
jgi:hypothetical protein